MRQTDGHGTLKRVWSANNQYKTDGRVNKNTAAARFLNGSYPTAAVGGPTTGTLVRRRWRRPVCRSRPVEYGPRMVGTLRRPALTAVWIEPKRARARAIRIQPLYNIITLGRGDTARHPCACTTTRAHRVSNRTKDNIFIIYIITHILCVRGRLVQTTVTLSINAAPILYTYIMHARHYIIL